MIVLRVLVGRGRTRDTVTRSAVGIFFTTTAHMPRGVSNTLEHSAAPQGAATELRTFSNSAYSCHDVHLVAVCQDFKQRIHMLQRPTINRFV